MAQRSTEEPGERARRERALEELCQLEERIAHRNRDLTEEQIEERAVRAGRETNQKLYDEWIARSNAHHVRHRSDS